MYEKIYHLLEKTGRVKTAMVISGTHKGRKCLIGQDGCRSFDGTESEDFWTEYEAELMNCQDTMVLHGNFSNPGYNRTSQYHHRSDKSQ